MGYEGYRVALDFPEDNNRTIEIELEKQGEELGEKAVMNSSNIGMLLRETTGVQIQQTSLSSGNLFYAQKY